MSTPLKSVGAITLFVADVERAKSFYRSAFDLSVVYEDVNSAVFKFDNLVINLLAAREAYSLIEPAFVAGQEAGSRFQLTIWVDNADAVCAEMNARGVELLNGPMNREWGMRTAAFADPDGHIWEVAQQI